MSNAHLVRYPQGGSYYSMADDISLKFSAEKLGKSLEGLAPKIEEELNQAVRNLAHSAYAAMISQMQGMAASPENRMAYLKALKFTELGNDTYLIHLQGSEANRMEQGYGSYSIRDLLMKSQKIVQVGSRSGEPWVRKAKDGHKWAVVPMEHKQNKVGSKGGDLATDIKQMFALNSKGEKQKFTQIFKDIDGKPIHGKVAVINDSINDKFQGITKYQNVHPSGKVSSIYMTFRGVSEAGKDWIHPGFAGYQLFKEAEKYVEDEMENIINTILK